MKTKDRFQVTQDAQLHSHLRKLSLQITDWADRAEKGKIRPRDIDRMRFEAAELEKLISYKEL